MSETIAVAEIDLDLNLDTFRKKLNLSSKEVKRSFKRSFKELDAEIQTFGSLVQDAVAPLITGLVAGGFGAIYAKLQDGSAQAEVFNKKLKNLAASAALVGEKILNMDFAGRNIGEWVDVLSDKIANLTENDLKKLIFLLGTLVTINFGAVLVKRFSEITDGVHNMNIKLKEALVKLAEFKAAKASASIASTGTGLAQGVGVGTGIGATKGLGSLRNIFKKPLKVTSHAPIPISDLMKPVPHGGFKKRFGGVSLPTEEAFPKPSLPIKGLSVATSAAKQAKDQANVALALKLIEQHNARNASIWGKMSKIFPTFTKASKSLLGSINLLVVAIAAVVVYFAAIGVGAKKLYDRSSEFRKVIDVIVKSLRFVVTMLWEALKGLGKAVSSGFDDAITNIAVSLKRAKYILTGQFDKIKGAAEEVELEKVANKVKAAAKKLNTKFKLFSDNIEKMTEELNLDTDKQKKAKELNKNLKALNDYLTEVNLQINQALKNQPAGIKFANADINTAGIKNTVEAEALNKRPLQKILDLQASITKKIDATKQELSDLDKKIVTPNIQGVDIDTSKILNRARDVIEEFGDKTFSSIADKLATLRSQRGSGSDILSKIKRDLLKVSTQIYDRLKIGDVTGANLLSGAKDRMMKFGDTIKSEVKRVEDAIIDAYSKEKEFRKKQADLVKRGRALLQDPTQDKSISGARVQAQDLVNTFTQSAFSFENEKRKFEQDAAKRDEEANRLRREWFENQKQHNKEQLGLDKERNAILSGAGGLPALVS